MHLHELLGWQGPMTHRQYVAWQEWLKIEQNQPDRGDHYVMQLTMQVEKIIRMWTKNTNGMKLSEFHIPFGAQTTTAPVKVEGPRSKKTPIPLADGEWYPHPLSAEEIAEAKKAIRTKGLSLRHK